MLKTENTSAIIGQLVETLAKNENLELNSEVMERIKDTCKHSAISIPHVHHLLMTQLRKDNARVRYNVLLAINELFLRCSAFRKLLEKSLQELLELTLETNPDRLLPPPKSVADRLKLKAQCFVKDWHTKFGDNCKIIKYAYLFLQSCHKVDFQRTNNHVSENRSHDSERRERNLEEKITRVKEEMKSREHEILNIVNQIETCFQLILPLPSELFTTDSFPTTSDTTIVIKSALPNVTDGELLVDTDEANPEHKVSLRHHGIHSIQTGLNIRVDEIASVTVKENADNAPILENMYDLHTQICKIYLPLVLKWLKLFTKAGNCLDHVKKAIDLKQMLEAKISKFREIKFESKIMGQEPSGGESKDSDSEFEEVTEKEGFEPVADMAMEATSSHCDSVTDKTNCSSASCIPTCCAMLPSGKLCPRQDKFKCPFHGKIIERDKNGIPVHECDRVRELDQPSTSQEILPDWQDPELLNDIAAETGIFLHLPKKRTKSDGRGKKHGRKSKQLSNTNPKDSTVYSRLYKKVFKKVRKK